MSKYLIVFFLMITPAAAEPLEIQVNCEQVKALVAEHGKLAAIKWALTNGFSMRQVNAARKKCDIK